MRQREAGPGTARTGQEGAEHSPLGVFGEVGDCKGRQGHSRRCCQPLYLRNQAEKAVRRRCEHFSACLGKSLEMGSWASADKGMFLHLLPLSPCVLPPGHPS